MPSAGEFGELDLGLSRQGCKRTERKFIVSILPAANEVSKTTERRAAEYRYNVKQVHTTGKGGRRRKE